MAPLYYCSPNPTGVPPDFFDSQHPNGGNPVSTTNINTATTTATTFATTTAVAVAVATVAEPSIPAKFKSEPKPGPEPEHKKRDLHCQNEESQHFANTNSSSVSVHSLFERQNYGSIGLYLLACAPGFYATATKVPCL